MQPSNHSPQFSPNKSGFDYPKHMHRQQPEGQTILLTGATSGIGFEILKTLVSQGHRVVTHYRDERGRAILCKFYPQVRCGHLDLCKFFDRSEYAPALSNFRPWVSGQVGKLDAMIINAGVTGFDWKGRFESWVQSEIWIASNSFMVDSFIDMLHDYDENNHLRGRVVYVSSALAENSIKGAEAYHRMKKETEKMLDKTFGKRRAAYADILPFIVRPGSVDTRMHEEILSKGSEELRERTKELIETGRLRSPKIIGAMIAEMATSGCAWNPETPTIQRPIERLERVEISDLEYNSFIEHLQV